MEMLVTSFMGESDNTCVEKSGYSRGRKLGVERKWGGGWEEEPLLLDTRYTGVWRLCETFTPSPLSSFEYPMHAPCSL